MIIGQIENGIVLDHITAGHGMEIYEVLGLGKLDSQNFPSCCLSLLAEYNKLNGKLERQLPQMPPNPITTLPHNHRVLNNLRQDELLCSLKSSNTLDHRKLSSPESMRLGSLIIHAFA